MNKEEFIRLFKRRLSEKFAMNVEDASRVELYQTLGSLIASSYSPYWRQTWQDYYEQQQKQLYYFSIEFLPGKLLKSNLLNMGWLELVREALADLGISLDELAAAEADMALGNGGLGRLASCFLDAIASQGLPGNGNGIRYEYGLFKQRFVDGYQLELPDDWLQQGNVWEVRRDSKAVRVHFGGQVYLKEEEDGVLVPVYEGGYDLLAIPYDTGIVGYENQSVNSLRLWSVEIPEEEEARYQSIAARREIENLTSVLYPDDSQTAGKKLRLQQEYFFVSAGLQSIVRYYKRIHQPITQINHYVAVHINDTHPALCVAEFMRILVDEEQVPWERAWDLTVKVMSYTNHTILAEALEKWPVAMLQEVCPRIYQIIEEIDRRFVQDQTGVQPYALIERTRVIFDGQVHMAHLAIIGSHSTNGVAKLHSDLLKSVVLTDFYCLYPDRFNNKTNGIAQRRWSQLINPGMSRVLDETIGNSWRWESNDLHLLMNYVEDDRVLAALAAEKYANKQALADYIEQSCGVVVAPEAIFDVQIKRLHAYKRQLLNLLHILKLYFDLKADPQLPLHPRVFIFGAKAAPSYHYAKTIIKVINEAAAMINQDLTLQGKIKIIFLENYNVSLAERIIPAADVSEQISLASKEASGTSNMKLMLNGAVTIATLDGANIEIRDAVGDDNIAIFGLTEAEVYAYYNELNYRSEVLYREDPILQRVLNALVDGTIPNCQEAGQELFDSLLYQDEYFILRDFKAYCAAQERINQAYLEPRRWQQMSLINIANAGRFSADDTVRRYAEDIWHIEPVFAHNERRENYYGAYLL